MKNFQAAVWTRAHRERRPRQGRWSRKILKIGNYKWLSWSGKTSDKFLNPDLNVIRISTKIEQFVACEHAPPPKFLTICRQRFKLSAKFLEFRYSAMVKKN